MLLREVSYDRIVHVTNLLPGRRHWRCMLLLGNFGQRLVRPFRELAVCKRISVRCIHWTDSSGAGSVGGSRLSCDMFWNP